MYAVSNPVLQFWISKIGNQERNDLPLLSLDSKVKRRPAFLFFTLVDVHPHIQKPFDHLHGNFNSFPDALID